MKLFKGKEKTSNNAVDVFNVTDGIVIPLSDVKDEVFSKEMLGKGVGVIPSGNGCVYSPVTGEICTVFPTKHAIGIRTVEGVEILIHIGIDTVGLNGEYFDCFIKQGQSISKGDKLCDIDFTGISEKGYDTTIMVIVTNTNEFDEILTNTNNNDSSEYIIRVLK